MLTCPLLAGISQQNQGGHQHIPKEQQKSLVWISAPLASPRARVCRRRGIAGIALPPTPLNWGVPEPARFKVWREARRGESKIQAPALICHIKASVGLPAPARPAGEQR